MIFLFIILVAMTSISLFALYRSVKRNLEFLEIIEQTNDQIVEAVDLLDYYYKRLDKKSRLELFSDDPTIRELVEDMKQARRAVSLISEKLTGEKNDTENQTTQVES